MITIGIDPHTRNHAAAALDDQGRVLAEFAVGSNPRELDRLARWIASMDAERIVAIEGARGFGLALARRLLAAGEVVLDVAPALTASERPSVRGSGKDDRRDALPRLLPAGKLDKAAGQTWCPWGESNTRHTV